MNEKYFTLKIDKINEVLKTDFELSSENGGYYTLYDKKINRKFYFRLRADVDKFQRHTFPLKFSPLRTKGFAFHNNVGFFLDGYCEFNYLGLHEIDIDNTIDEINSYFKGEFTVLKERFCSDIFKFMHFNYFEDKKSHKSLTIKIANCRIDNYLDILNKVILFINRKIINEEKSNTLSDLRLFGLTRGSSSYSTSREAWTRNYLMGQTDTIPMIYFASSIDYDKPDFYTFLQSYRAIESAYEKPNNTIVKFENLIKEVDYEIKNKELTADKIIGIRDRLTHNETNLNMVFLLNENEKDILSVKNELMEMFKHFLLTEKKFSIPESNMLITEDFFKGLYLYNSETKSGEIEILINSFLDGLYADEILKNTRYREGSLEKFDYEISPASSNYLKANGYESEVIQTLKISNTSKEHFLKDVYNIFALLCITTLENTNSFEGIVFPDIRNTDGGFFELYNEEKYTDIKKGFEVDEKHAGKIHHFNDAVSALNNVQYASYYLFLQRFFSSDSTNKRTEHAKEVRKLFGKYYKKTSLEIRKKYEKKFLEKNPNGNIKNIHKFFSSFRNNTFHANPEIGAHVLFYYDDEILIQTMMARELSIIILNEEVLK